jgi:hypothetical protein
MSIAEINTVDKTPIYTNGAPPGRATAAQVDHFASDSINDLINASRPRGLFERWGVRTLVNAYADRPPTQYAVNQLFALPSLNIVYGGPGSLKSMLLADMAICVATGQPWLAGLPTEEGQDVRAYATMPAPVLWIDYDNGTRRTDERFEALANARGLPSDAPIHYVSMADPWLDATDGFMIAELGQAIRDMGVKVIIIDNLGLICGDTEENSAAMAKPMSNLRRLAESCEAAVIVIHHQRKGSMADRAGDLLRGHSSIEASLDLALLVTRDGQSPALTIAPTKVRGASIASSFEAEFTYEHKPGTLDLATARMWGRCIESPRQREATDIAAAISIAINRLRQSGTATTQKAITNAAIDYISANLDIKKPGINKVRGVLTEMITDGRVITEQGADNAKLHRMAT